MAFDFNTFGNSEETKPKVIDNRKFNFDTFGEESQPEEKKGFFRTAGEALISSEKGFGESIGQAISTSSLGKYAGIDAKKEAETNNARYMKAGNDMVNLAKKTLDPIKRETYINLAQEYFGKAGQGIQDIVGELKTTKQVLGEAAGVVLDVATAGTYGQAAKAAKTGQLLKPIAKTTPTIISKAAASGAKQLGQKMAAGAGIGYGYDVASNLEQNKEGVDVLTPGLGTVAGAVTPALITAGSKALKGTKTLVSGEGRAEKAFSKAEQELVNIENNYTKIRKASEYSKDNLSGSRRRILESDVLPGTVDDTGTIRTQEAAKKYKSQVIDGAEGVVKENLAKEGVSVSPNVIRLQLRKEILSSGLEGKQLKRALNSIEDEIEGLSLRSGETGNIPLTSLQDAKINAYSGINFQSDGWVKAEQKAIARAYKKVIENSSKFNVREVNQELSKYYEDLNYLELLDGKKVRGGKLGKYAAQIAGNIGGAVVGGTVGGPGGAAIGTVVGGELAGKIKGMLLSKAFGKSTGKGATKSTILEKASAKAKEEPLRIGQERLSSVQSMAVNKPTTKDSNMATAKQTSGKKSSFIEKMFPQKGKESPKAVAKTILDKTKKVRPGMNLEDVSRYTKGQGGKFSGSTKITGERAINHYKDQVKEVIKKMGYQDNPENFTEKFWELNPKIASKIGEENLKKLYHRAADILWNSITP